ncbi:MAG: hypothetical protein SVJ22_10845 [Halobacteriota archaeon]|nr:hypothetical protein [Halobacteriota archaeon]
MPHSTIKVEPTESRCVETVAKKMYWSLVDEYLGLGEDDTEKEEKIELLRRFLEESDVGFYRSKTDEIMRGGDKPYLLLAMNDDETLDVRIEVRR